MKIKIYGSQYHWQNYKQFPHLVCKYKNIKCHKKLFDNGIDTVEKLANQNSKELADKFPNPQKGYTHDDLVRQAQLIVDLDHEGLEKLLSELPRSTKVD